MKKAYLLDIIITKIAILVYLAISDCKFKGKFKSNCQFNEKVGIYSSLFEDEVYFNYCKFNDFFLTHNNFEKRLFLDNCLFAGIIDIGSSSFDNLHVNNIKVGKCKDKQFTEYTGYKKYNYYIDDLRKNENIDTALNKYIPLSNKQSKIYNDKVDIENAIYKNIAAKKLYTEDHFNTPIEEVENTRVSISLMKSAYIQQNNVVDANKITIF